MRRSRFFTAIRNIFKNALMSFASIVSVAFTLIMLGLVILLLVNSNYATQKVEERFDTMKYVIDDNMNNAQIQTLKTNIEGMDNIKEVILVDKQEALAWMSEVLGEDALEGLRNNPLPNTFEITIDDISIAQETALQLEDIDNGENVRYNQNVARIITNFSRVVRIVGSVLIIALLFITILSIVNTIRVGISSRQTEITIMRYVGATRGYIRGPFLIEGAILGLIGALVSAVTIYYSYSQVQALLQRSLVRMTSQIMITDPNLLYQVILLNVVIGVSVGFLGSLYSMRKHLKV